MLCAPIRLSICEYKRREPQQELLHQVLLAHLETFFANIEAESQYFPMHVEKELRDFLKCGVLAREFVRMRCNDCGKSLVVGFSCKGRGFCPSCTGRRMADTSARLVDDTFPGGVPVRQWVLSLPIQIRYRLAPDGKLRSAVLRIFLRVVNGWCRKHVKERGIKESLGGSVTFAQRFGSALNLLNPHFHSLLLDGMFNTATNIFHPAPSIEDEDVKTIVEITAQRVIRMLKQRGVLNENEYDTFAEEQPVLASMTSVSIIGLVSMGERAGLRVHRVLQDPAEGVKTGHLCFCLAGIQFACGDADCRRQ